MRSHRTKSFRKFYDLLPLEMKRQAKEAYKLWRADPQHPSLHFKVVNSQLSVWSVRINQNYRAMGVKQRTRDGDDMMIWFFIGNHGTYERKIDVIKKIIAELLK